MKKKFTSKLLIFIGSITTTIIFYSIIAILFFPSLENKGAAITFAIIWIVIELIRVSITSLKQTNAIIIIKSASMLMEI